MNLQYIKYISSLANELQNHLADRTSSNLSILVDALVYISIRKYPEPLSDKFISWVYTITPKYFLSMCDILKIRALTGFLPEHFLGRILYDLITSGKESKIKFFFKEFNETTSINDIAYALINLQNYSQKANPKKDEHPICKLIKILKCKLEDQTLEELIKLWIDIGCDYRKLNEFKEYIPEDWFPWTLERLPVNSQELKEFYEQFDGVKTKQDFLFHILCRHIDLYQENTQLLLTIVTSLNMNQWHEIIEGGIVFMERQVFGEGESNFLWDLFELKTSGGFLIPDTKVLELCEEVFPQCLGCTTYILPESRLVSLIANLESKYGFEQSFNKNKDNLKSLLKAIIAQPCTCDLRFNLPYIANRAFLSWTKLDGKPIFSEELCKELLIDCIF